jgi:NADPH:quinone reductase-like Zn-dependent oxidoreductase
MSDGIVFPRILGIEAVGIIDDDPSGTFAKGQQVMTMMGGMGRDFDGGYAEYVCVPIHQIIPFDSQLDWSVLGAVPEMLQTAYGSLLTGLQIEAGQTLLIRGGTSSVGMAAAILAQKRGLSVISTTRNPAKIRSLMDMGVDHVLVDKGSIADQVHDLHAGGVDAALELVGAPTLRDTLQTVRIHGHVCFTGMLSNQWVVKDFYPIDFIPQGVYLTAYSGEANDLPALILQEFLQDVADGRMRLPIDSVYSMDQIRQAHSRMESNDAHGKIVIRV